MPSPCTRTDLERLVVGHAFVIVATTLNGCSAGAGGASTGLDASGGSTDGRTDAGLESGSAATGDSMSGAEGGPSDASLCAFSLEEAGVCNDVSPGGPAVDIACVGGEPPEPQGGVIEDGTYVLQSSVIYGVCDAEPASATTWSICGNEWMVAQMSYADGGSALYRVDYSATVGTSSVTLTPTCQVNTGNSEQTMTRGYTSSGGTLTFITSYTLSNGISVIVGTYAKQ